MYLFQSWAPSYPTDVTAFSSHLKATSLFLFQYFFIAPGLLFLEFPLLAFSFFISDILLFIWQIWQDGYSSIFS